MHQLELCKQLQLHVEAIVAQRQGQALDIWVEFLKQHPADIAQCLTNLPIDSFKALFACIKPPLQEKVFDELSDVMKVQALAAVGTDEEKGRLLRSMHIDELTDLFEYFSDHELKQYIRLLSAHDRKKVTSLMKFDPESAGGIMDTDVFTLTDTITVEKGIHILQRLSPRSDLHQQIFVTNSSHHIVGHIRLEDLVLKSPHTLISSILRENELLIQVGEDREEIAHKMVHYGLTIAPVVDKEGVFLGVIPSDTLIDIIEQEATEDVQKMSAMAPIKYPYFQTSFFRILYERSYILIALLLAQTVSSMIIDSYHVLLSGFLISFITMLISTGGNTSSQTSAIVIQGMASGEITPANIRKFIRREVLMAFMMAIILGSIAFIRVYMTHGHLLGSIAVSLSLGAIVMFAVLLGSFIPLLFERLNIDPAFAAGPFLATIMDIFGLLLYCYISSFFLG
jgi:magnesium transporter